MQDFFQQDLPEELNANNIRRVLRSIQNNNNSNNLNNSNNNTQSSNFANGSTNTYHASSMNSPLIPADVLANSPDGSIVKGNRFSGLNVDSVTLSSIESLDAINMAFSVLKKFFTDNSMFALCVDVVGKNFANINPLYYVIQTNQNVDIKRFVEFFKDKLNYPNNYETGYELLKETGMSLENFGNAYWQVRKTDINSIHSIHFIPADAIRPIPYYNEETKDLEFAYVQLDANYETIEHVYFDDEIVHFKMPNHLGQVLGYPPALSAVTELIYDEEVKNYLNTYFTKAFSAGMIFSMENSTKEMVKRNKEQIKAHYTGGKNFMKALITEGDTKLIWDGNKLKDGFPLIQLKESIMNLFMPLMGVPLTVAGVNPINVQTGSDLIYANEQTHLRHLADITRIFEGTINLKILRNPYIVSEKVIGNMEVKLGLNNTFSRKYAGETVKNAAEYGIKLKDALQMLGLPMPENEELGDTYIVKTNNGIIPMENIIEYMPEKMELQNKKLAVEIENLKASIVQANSSNTQTSTKSDDSYKDKQSEIQSEVSNGTPSLPNDKKSSKTETSMKISQESNKAEFD